MFDRQELDSTQSELDEVKEMYITVSQTKEQIRENTDQLWVEKMESKLAEVCTRGHESFRSFRI